MKTYTIIAGIVIVSEHTSTVPDKKCIQNDLYVTYGHFSNRVYRAESHWGEHINKTDRMIVEQRITKLRLDSSACIQFIIWPYYTIEKCKTGWTNIYQHHNFLQLAMCCSLVNTWHWRYHRKHTNVNKIWYHNNYWDCVIQQNPRNGLQNVRLCAYNV